MTPNTQLVETKEKAMEFTPFGQVDKIKLSVEIIKKLVAVPTKSGQVCGDRDALRFMMLCQAQRLNPFAGDAFLIGYDTKNGPSFSLITAHVAFLKRAESHADYDGMTSGIVVMTENGPEDRTGDFHLSDEQVLGGWARVKRKSQSIQIYRRIRMERFNKGFGQWEVDAAGMICKCAEADALRSAFPSLVGGLYIQGETEGAIDITEKAAKVSVPHQITMTEPVADHAPTPQPEQPTDGMTLRDKVVAIALENEVKPQQITKACAGIQAYADDGKTLTNEAVAVLAKKWSVK